VWTGDREDKAYEDLPHIYMDTELRVREFMTSRDLHMASCITMDPPLPTR
jgi:hypothetical protein